MDWMQDFWQIFALEWGTLALLFLLGTVVYLRCCELGKSDKLPPMYYI